MKLKDLSSVLWTPVGCMQYTIVYNITDNIEMERLCSVEDAVKYYGDWRANRLFSYYDYEEKCDYIVIHLEKEY